MKKKINILYLLFILFLILLSNITKGSDIFPLVLSLSLSMIFYNVFSNININDTLNKYKNKYKVYRIIFIFIGLIFIMLSVISYLLGNIININNQGIINLLSVVFIFTILMVKIDGIYLTYTKYKRLGIKLFNVYQMILLLVDSILCILLYKVFSFSNNTNIMVLYLVNIVLFIIVMIVLHVFVIKRDNTKERYNYRVIISDLFNINYSNIIFSVINDSYIYTSIIILYYALINKYNYSYLTTGTMITNIFFYGMYLIKYISYLIRKYLYLNINNYNKQIIKVINYLVSISILFMIISGPLTRVLFNTYNYLFDLMLLLLFYTLYNYIIKISIMINNNKINNIVLFSGIIIKLLFELPLINANYRMGYSLSFGSILSIILGMLTSIIVAGIFINKRLKFSILNNFGSILNIVYENIILCFILVLFTLIVKVDTDSLVINILVIIFYVGTTIGLKKLRKKINK